MGSIIRRAIIRFEKVIKRFDDFLIDNISFEVYPGSCFGIVGKNGAGKTTLLRLMLGEIKRDSGIIEVFGLDPNSNGDKIKEIVGYVPEQESPPSFLTVIEFLTFVAKIRKLKDYDLDFWLDFFDLHNYRDVLIKDLSRGTKQKLMFAQAFLHDPDVAIIDEPLVNLDPITQEKVIKYLKSIVKKGKTVILSSHMINLITRLCNSALVLDNGKVKGLVKLKGLLKESKIMSLLK